MKTLAGFGVIWAGYTLLYYGVTNVLHREVGIVDLIYPSRIPALAAKLSAGSSSASGGSAAPQVPTPSGGSAAPQVPTPSPGPEPGALLPGAINGIVSA